MTKPLRSKVPFVSRSCWCQRLSSKFRVYCIQDLCYDSYFNRSEVQKTLYPEAIEVVYAALGFAGFGDGAAGLCGCKPRCPVNLGVLELGEALEGFVGALIVRIGFGV